MKKFEAVTHKDIKGKELYYIKISNAQRLHIINVGKKTHDEVKKLEEDDNQLELPITGNAQIENKNISGEINSKEKIEEAEKQSRGETAREEQARQEKETQEKIKATEKAIKEKEKK